MRQICGFFFLQDCSYSATQSFWHISDSFLKYSNLPLHRVFRNLSKRQLVKNPVQCCLHLFMTNSYNPCSVCYGSILDSWERVTLYCKRETKANYDFDLINADQALLTVNPSSKVEACICPKARLSTNAATPAVWSTEQGNETLKHC